MKKMGINGGGDGVKWEMLKFFRNPRKLPPSAKKMLESGRYWNFGKILKIIPLLKAPRKD